MNQLITVCLIFTTWTTFFTRWMSFCRLCERCGFYCSASVSKYTSAWTWRALRIVGNFVEICWSSFYNQNRTNRITISDCSANDSGQEAREYFTTAEFHFSIVNDARITYLCETHCLYIRCHDNDVEFLKVSTFSLHPNLSNFLWLWYFERLMQCMQIGLPKNHCWRWGRSGGS